MNHTHAGDRDSKSVHAGDTDQNLGAETINQPSEVETMELWEFAFQPSHACSTMPTSTSSLVES